MESSPGVTVTTLGGERNSSRRISSVVTVNSPMAARSGSNTVVVVLDGGTVSGTVLVTAVAVPVVRVVAGVPLQAPAKTARSTTAMRIRGTRGG